MFLIDDVKDSDVTNTHGKNKVETIEKSEKVKCRNCNKEISEKMSQAFGGLCSSCKQKGVK